MKPFDLEKALTGEPVKLRDGRKAFVKYSMPDDYKGLYPLRGYIIDKNSNFGSCDAVWTKDGNGHIGTYVASNIDIISMWEEPRPRVQLDLPAPLKVPQVGVWYEVIKSIFTEKEDDSGPYVLDTRLYFATKEDADEWINAMKGARR